MASEWKILWTRQARSSYFLILDYLAENWTRKEFLQFVHRVELVLQVVKKNPRMFAASAIQKNIRKAFVDKNNSFFYQADNSQKRIVILSFYDNRQDPRKFKF